MMSRVFRPKQTAWIKGLWGIHNFETVRLGQQSSIGWIDYFKSLNKNLKDFSKANAHSNTDH